MKEGSNIILILICSILVLFLFATIFYVSKSNNIRNNENESNLSVGTDNLEALPKNDYKEEINQTIQKEEISKYTTKIYDDDKNRVYNIKLACKTLNNTIVKPNEEFSFNKKLGSMGEDEGYKKAKGFDSNGNDIKVFGGGICQLSSTLYNTILIAKLKVTERHAHSKRVYYVPKNKDATVFSGGPDLKFVNNSDSDIMINASTNGNKVTVKLSKLKK